MFLQHIVGFIDPSADPSNPGWPLCNLLTCFHALYPSTTSTVHILCWHDSEIANKFPHANHDLDNQQTRISLSPFPVEDSWVIRLHLDPSVASLIDLYHEHGKLKLS